MVGLKEEDQDTANYFQEVFKQALWLRSFQRNTWSDSNYESFNSEKFVYFLKRLTKSINDSYAFIWDNCKIQALKEVQDYLWNNKLWLITIQAYYPFVNTWEKLILIIKSRVRIEERKSKVVNQQMFKKFIDSIKSWELQKGISESFKESSELIHKIIIPDSWNFKNQVL